jgi:cell division septal protein FtsQ
VFRDRVRARAKGRRGVRRISWRVSIPRFFIILLLLLSIRTSLGELSSSSPLRISSVEVYGNRFVKADEIVRKAGIFPGDNALEVSLEKAYKGIMEISRIRRAWVSRAIPTKVRIKVEERVPIALVKWKGGIVYEVDREGVLMKLSPPSEGSIPDLPIISWRGRSGEPPARLIKDGVKALEEISSASPSFASRISEVDVSDPDVLSVRTMWEDCKILMDPKEIRRSVVRAERLLSLIGDVELLDLTHEDRAIVKRKAGKR